jgi:mannosylglycoprotein endo-beta-mannosidase
MHGLTFNVNNHHVFLQGGNWITTDMFYRFNNDFTRYFHEVNLHKHAGLNLIRLWGGNGNHGRGLYEAADVLGVFLMVEGAGSGDNNGRWGGSSTYPLDADLLVRAMSDKIRFVRGHSSVLFYCGGNEVDWTWKIPSRVAPLVETYDPAKHFIRSSMSNFTQFDPLDALAPQDGPYGIMRESIFFTRNPGLNKPNFSIGFQPELGSISNPVYESMARFLTTPTLEDIPRENATSGDIVNSVWQYHTYLPFTDSSGADFLYAYGAPANASEYALNSQLVQLRQFKGLYEGFQHAMFVYYGTYIMWKTQSPWPSFRGFLYDSYLAQTGGFYGVRQATGGSYPYHISLNQYNSTISVLNKGLYDLKESLVAVVSVYDVASGQELGTRVTQYVPTGISSGQVIQLPQGVQWPSAASMSDVLLFRLTLMSLNASVVFKTNDYWLNTLNASAYNDFRLLGTLRHSARVPVVATLISSAVRNVSGTTVLDISMNVSLPVSTSAVAVAVHLSLHDLANPVTAATGFVDTRVLPSSYSDNYFSLVPGESRIIECSVMYLSGSMIPTSPQFEMHIAGFNVVSQTVQIATSL